jgi:hypothetical protein
MSPLDTVAKQRDEAQTKLRQMSAELDAAKAEIARLKGERPDPMRSTFPPPIPTVSDRSPGHVPPHPIPADVPRFPDGGYVGTPEVPTVTPPKAKRSGIFGGPR